MFHSTVLFQLAKHLSNLASLLADCNIDADQVPTLLVNNCVEGDSTLPSGTITNNELALAAANGNHGINGLDTRLNRRINALAEGDTRRNPFYWSGFGSTNRTLPINRITKSINHAADEFIAHGYLNDAASGPHLIALFDVLIVAQHHRAYGLFLKVESKAHRPIGELKQLGIASITEAMGSSHAVAGLNNDTYVSCDRRSLKLLDLLSEDGCDLFGANGHAASLLFGAALGAA